MQQKITEKTLLGGNLEKKTRQSNSLDRHYKGDIDYLSCVWTS